MTAPGWSLTLSIFDFVIFGLNFLPDFANCLLALMEKQF